MKKWNEPKVWTLGVENTREDNDFQDIEMLSSWGDHACHREPGKHDGNCSSPGKGHIGIETGNCSTHIETVYTDNKTGKEYSCCCLS